MLKADETLDFHNRQIAAVALGERCKKAKQSQAYILTSPLGHVYTNACPDGLHCVKLYGDTSYDNIRWETKVDFDRASSFMAINKHVVDLKKWLAQYFKNPIECKRMPITFCGLDDYGEFNSKVWMTIFDNCPPGELMSYVELAQQSGYGAGASKVVGYAINKNPYMLVVGDHRIVRATGEIWCENESQRNKLRRALTFFEISFTGRSLDDALAIVRERNQRNKGSRKRTSTVRDGSPARKSRVGASAKRVKKEELEDTDDEYDGAVEDEKPPRVRKTTKADAKKKPLVKKKHGAARRGRRVKKEETSEEESEMEEEDTTEDDE